MKILIIDDEVEVLVSLQRLLKRQGYSEVDTCDHGSEAIKAISNNDYDVVLLDLLLPDKHGLEILQATKPYKPSTEFIILTAVDEVQSAVLAVKSGAYDYLVKPTEPERIFLSIERAYERIQLKSGLSVFQRDRKAESVNEVFKEIVTKSKRMKELFAYTEVMVKSGNPILITGESGTGKELLARAIHQLGQGAKGPFIPINVASVPESLFESQFFGHSAGAFTGAKGFDGYFKQANNGTLFLDEIGELPLNQQVKFLRVLEEHHITPLGESAAVPVNVRIISATNIDIDEACRNGRFRLDLFYRLKSAHIHLPPLRERMEDIPLLINYFVSKFSKRYNKKIAEISKEVIHFLSGREYKGNIRELGQILENAVLLAQGEQLAPEHFGKESFTSIPSQNNIFGSIKENTEAHVLRVLEHTKGDKKRAAEILGVSLRHVQRLVTELGKAKKQ